MKDSQLVSVLMPVYNVAPYVKEAVKSIQDQTYRNIEIIIIDDGSTDNTPEIVEELAAQDDRIKFYENEKNLRIVKTLNRALDLASGEYVLRMDGDDISAPDRIETKLKFLEKNPDVDLVGCSLITIDSDGNEINKVRKLQDFDLIKNTLRYTSPVSHIWLCKKEVYSRLNGYRELSGAEDYDFILRLISSGMKAVNISDYYGYSVRIGRVGNTVSSTGLLQKKTHEYIYRLYMQRLARGVDDFGFSTVPKPYAVSNMFFSFSTRCFNEARSALSRKNYYLMLYKLLLSLVSPHQVHLYYLRLVYRLKVKDKL